MVKSWAFGLVLGLLSASASAQVSVDTPWVRGTVEGQKATGAFMDLKAEKDLTLVAASSPVAKIAEIHAMEMKDGIMKMHAIKSLPLPAGKTVRLAPGGYHLMLMELKAPLANGETVPITLTFQDEAKKTSAVEIKAEVRGLGLGMQKGHGHKH